MYMYIHVYTLFNNSSFVPRLPPTCVCRGSKVITCNSFMCEYIYGGEPGHKATIIIVQLTNFKPTHNNCFSSQVKGITGPNKGLIGSLINIDEGDGIVKLDADSALKIIALDNLAKYVAKQQ